MPDQANTSPAPVWGAVGFSSASPSMGWWFLLCLPQLGDVERCCARQGKQLPEWLVCEAPAERWQPLGKEWSTPPIFATHPGVKPLGGVAPGWQAEVGGQAASFPR